MAEDETMLKTLSSGTRRDIIKELSNGYRTPSDLSKILRKSKSTTVEHLEKLVDTGLVSKSVSPGRKWVFYSLTKKGESLVPQRSDRIVFVLALVFLTFSIGLLSFYKYYTQPISLQEYTIYKDDGIIKGVQVPGGGASEEGKTITGRNIAFFAAGIGMFSLSLALLGYFLYLKSRNSRIRPV